MDLEKQRLYAITLLSDKLNTNMSEGILSVQRKLKTCIVAFLREVYFTKYRGEDK
jgi:hypothetical protein